MTNHSDIPSTIKIKTSSVLILIVLLSFVSIGMNFLAFAKIDALQTALTTGITVNAGSGSSGSSGSSDFGGSDGLAANAAPSGGTAADAPSGVVIPEIDGDPVLGADDAPITIYEFSDYECPFCGRFRDDTFDQIKSQYIDTGKVKLVYKDFPLSFHASAMPAALAAECVGAQGDKYWEMHDLLFEAQGGANFNADAFRGMAEGLGIDMTEYDACITDPATKAEIDGDTAEGVAAGIRGTPGFIINGEIVSGAQPFSVFQQIIDAQLGGN